MRRPRRKVPDRVALLLLALAARTAQVEADAEVRLCAGCGRVVEGETCCPEPCS